MLAAAVRASVRAAQAPAAAARVTTVVARAHHLVRPLRVRRFATDAVVSEAKAGAGSGAGGSARTRRVGYWVMTTAGMVFVMVVLGGVTRLTRSGLSIVEWRPEGEKLPRTDEEWAVEFEKYKAYPEFQRVNRHMSLDEFKPIYFMEWFHRFWGRAIGVAFGLPMIYYTATKAIPRPLWGRFGLLLGLGAAQGGVGWWMVKSGLEHDRFGEHAIPRVSPYRLATHLGFAFSLYSALVWTGLDLLRAAVPGGGMAGIAGLPAAAQEAAVANVKRLRPWALAATGILATTVASGAFVAGNDAGHAYNDWPLMAGRVIPEQFWEESLGVRNIFENTATVQFDHRYLAYATFLAVGGLHSIAKQRCGGLTTMPGPVRKGLIWMGGLVAAQVALGISTLMLYVPVPLAAAHQGGALALLTAAIYTLHGISQVAKHKVVAPAAAAVAGAGAATAAAPAAAAAVPNKAKAAAAAAAFVLGMPVIAGDKRLLHEEM